MQVHEDDISAVLEEACDPSKLSGRWITQYDIVEVRERVRMHKSMFLLSGAYSFEATIYSSSNISIVHTA